MPAYNHPDQTEPQELVHGLKAIKILKQQSKSDIETKNVILQKLSTFSLDATLSDYEKGSLLYAISEIATDDNEFIVLGLINNRVKYDEKSDAHSNEYENYYLNNLKSKFNY